MTRDYIDDETFDAYPNDTSGLRQVWAYHPERKREPLVKFGNGEFEVSYNPPPIRRTMWRYLMRGLQFIAALIFTGLVIQWLIGGAS